MIRKVMISLQKTVKKVIFRKVCLGDRQRIVELGVFAEALGNCCGEGCSSTLDLSNRE